MSFCFSSQFLSRLKDRIVYPQAFSILAELNNTQWASLYDNTNSQYDALKKLLTFVSRYNPYYRSLFRKHHIDPQHVWEPEDFNKIPFLTKEKVRAHFSELISRKGFYYLKITSSGSTASPVTVLRDKLYHERILAARWRALGWWGISSHDRSVQIWGKPIHQLRKGNFPITKSVLKNCLYLSAFEMSNDTMPEYVRALECYKPAYIFGYANSLYRLACFILDSRMVHKLPRIKLVVSSAEILFYNQRLVIERAFQCPVANFYNAIEAGLIAAECPYKSMHMTTENLYFEYIPSDKMLPDASKLCITQLFNYKFPLIRYQMDDIVKISHEPCPCGRTLPIIKEIHGRTFDLLISKDGKFIHGAFFCYLIDHVGGVRFYRVIQKDSNHIQYFIVKNDQAKDINTEYVTKNIQYLMGDDTKVDFLFVDSVDELPIDSTGKYRYVSTKVEKHD